MADQPDELTAEIEQAMLEMADEGLVELTYDEAKGTLAYRLTDEGMQAARELMLRLTEDHGGDDPVGGDVVAGD